MFNERWGEWRTRGRVEVGCQDDGHLTALLSETGSQAFGGGEPLDKATIACHFNQKSKSLIDLHPMPVWQARKQESVELEEVREPSFQEKAATLAFFP